MLGIEIFHRLKFRTLDGHPALLDFQQVVQNCADMQGFEHLSALVKGIIHSGCGRHLDSITAGWLPFVLDFTVELFGQSRATWPCSEQVKHSPLASISLDRSADIFFSGGEDLLFPGR
jgi:hypothetical protein